MAASARERFVGALSNRLLRIYFRRLEVIGADRLPRGGPRVVVANHVNGLLDPMFVFGPLGIPARMLGKATLWRIPGIAQLADLAGGIPIQRRQDPGADPAKNVEAFAAAHDVLAAGGAIAVFPEGISHDQPRLQPLRTGAARIVLEAERRYPTRGPLGVRIVPIGLVFERREKFRSRALVVVGEPLDPAPEIAAAREDERAAVRALTERIAAALEAVTLNYESWEESRLVALGADVVVRERDGGRRPLGREFELRRTLVAALARLRASHPADVAEAVEAGRSYERLLRAARLDDAHVAARVGWSPALRFFLVALARLLLASPLALVGTALNLVPWLVVDLVSRFVRDEPNQISTYRLFPGLLLYPAAWIAAAVVAGRALGAASGVGVGLVAPLAGWVALRWHERRRALWRETRAFLLLRGRRSVAGELRARRARVEQAVERLAGYLSESDSASSRA
jgi:1-acyl-sn-glycerol-3-phosphate acyltransferase